MPEQQTQNQNGAGEKSPAQQFNENMGQLLQCLIVGQHRFLQRHLVVVRYAPRSSFLFACHRYKSGVLIETGMKLTDPRFDSVVARAAQAALEVLQDRTTAVEVRLSMEVEA